MKRVLFVSFCPRRGNTTGITGKLIDSLSELDKSKYEISLLDTNFFEEGHNARDFKSDRYFALRSYSWDRVIKKIPYIRTFYAVLLALITLRQTLADIRYNLVVIFHIPSCADKYVKICKKARVKVLMYPWGSDILCCSNIAKFHIKRAFANTDFVGGNAKSNCMLSAQNDYGVPNEKILIQKNYITGVRVLQNLIGTKNRFQMHKILNIPYSNFNIICGYNGYPTHRHHVILDALIENKLILPKDYQLIFPMTYGASHEYYESVKARCEENQLNAIFLQNFITNEQMAYLHMITDVFINIQESDCGNAFMIEALFSQNRIITGKWLNYDQFEQFGIPYHLINMPEDLSMELKNVILHPDNKPHIPNELIDNYRVPHNYIKGSFWTDVLDKL